LHNLSSHNLTADEAMTRLTGGSIQLLHNSKSKKWCIKAWGIANSINGYVPKCCTCKGEIRSQR
jgi:hypothetical protein